MLQHQTSLHCSRRFALLILTAIALCFLLIGCAALFKSAGLTAEQADQQATLIREALADAAAGAVTDIQTGLAQGHDLKTIAVKTGSAFIWKLATLAASTAGTLLSALLAKYLGTERKLTKVMITGIEDNANPDLKKIIKAKAKTAGVQPTLDARVQSLT